MKENEEENDEEDEGENDEMEEEENNEENECSKNEEEDELISQYIIEMGNHLHQLLQNISKLPTPPPTNNNININKEEYRNMLIKHLSQISILSEFIINEDFMIPIDYPIKRSILSRKSSISFILNNEVIESEDDDQEMHSDALSHQININPDDPLINREVVANLDVPILNLTPDEQQVNCTIIADIIIRIYETSLNDQANSEVIRRRQFRHLVLFLNYYEKLEVFCNLNKQRKKGRTVKNQAIGMIIRLSKRSEAEPPRMKHTTISTILNRGSRVRKLLKIASDNYNIIDAFPDLEPSLFSATKISVVNYERWLKLVEIGQLISFKDGAQLYEDFKTEAKEKRRDNLNKFKLS